MPVMRLDSADALLMPENRYGTLVVLACHGVFDPVTQRLYAEHPEDRPIYEAHLHYAVRHLAWRAELLPLLVLSGGPTQRQRPCSESQSYVEWAHTLHIDLPVHVALEEYALTSIENLLLSLYVYHRTRGRYPEAVDVISWAFKYARFEATLQAINHWAPLGHTWPAVQFFPVGDLWGRARDRALEDEARYISALQGGLVAYYQEQAVQALIRQRDVYDSRARARLCYAGYPLPF